MDCFKGPTQPSPVGRAFKIKKVSPTGGDLEGAE